MSSADQTPGGPNGGACLIFGDSPPHISGALGICARCLRARFPEARPRVEAVHAAARAQFQCKFAAYHEPQWWHHRPVIADRFPGAEEVNRRGISLPYFTKDVPELLDQYIQAFEKVWAHRQQLAKV